MRNRFACARVGAFCLIVLAGCTVLGQDVSATPSSSQTGVPSGNLATSSLIPGASVGALSPGDLIDYSVYGVPEMTQRTRVASDGTLSLPLLDRVQIGGLTTEQAQRKIEQILVSSGLLKTPHVNISVVEFANGISILGEIVRPGIYPVSGSRNLYDVLAAAGGLTPNAGNLVTISHKTGGVSDTVSVAKDPAKSLTGNVLIQPGDTVIVGKAPVVYVVGEVIAPSGFLLDGTETLTVMRAIAMAHGTSRDAKLNAAKIIRKNESSFVEIPVPLSKIMSAKAQDVELQPNDIVFVPTNSAKGAARKTLDTALSLATGVTLVRASR